MLKSAQRLPRNFIKASISARLKCPICFEVYYKPRRLFCGHTFCKPCLQDLCNPQHHKNPEHVNSCPLCRTPIDSSKIGYDHFATKIIDELEVACPVYGCAWKGENHMLDTHYKHECKLKTLVRKVARGAREFDCEGDEYLEKDEGKEHTIKGAVFSRSAITNPARMMEVMKQSVAQQKYQPPSQPQLPKKRLITCGTQTHPVRILPVKRIKRPIQIARPALTALPHITPVNGFDPIPANLLKNRPKNLATRIKQENMRSAASSSEEMREIRQLYADMDFTYSEQHTHTQGIDFNSDAEPIDLDE